MSSTEQTEIENAKVKLRTSGELTISEDGTTPTIIGHYNKKTEELQFESEAYREKYYTQAVSRIGTVNKGQEVSQYRISKITIKGMKSNIPADAPEMPNPEDFKQGDAAEEVVSWLLQYDLPHAIARYGIYLDKAGKPIRKPVKRVVVYTVDNRNLEDSQIPENRQGKTSTKGPVAQEGELVEDKQGIIARRATALTFTPNEVVGGFRPTAGYRAPVAVTLDGEDS